MSLSDNDVWIVYCHTNKINGKKYIGITKNSLKRRCGKNGERYTRSKHGCFKNAILKYGWDNFDHHILENNLSEKEAKEKEIYYIREWGTYIGLKDSKGYNATLGGDGGSGRIVSEEFKESMRKKYTGKKNGGLHVICNNIEYNSITDCAEAYGVSVRNISNWLLKRYSPPNKFYDMKLRYKDSDFDLKKRETGKIHRERNRKGVICITTNRKFESLTEASKFYGIKYKSTISDCCKGISKTTGSKDGLRLKWAFCD